MTRSEKKMLKIEKLLILQTSFGCPICFSSWAYKLTETRFYSKNIEFCCLRRKVIELSSVLIRKLENSQNNSIIKIFTSLHLLSFVLLNKEKQNSIFLIHKLFSWVRKKSSREKNRFSVSFFIPFFSFFFNQTKRKNYNKTRKKERERL